MLGVHKENNNVSLPLIKDNRIFKSQLLDAGLHAVVLLRILKFLLKRKASGKLKSARFKFKDQDVEFYYVQRVDKLDFPAGASRSAPSWRITFALVREALEYPPLNEYFIIEHLDKTHFAIWVRADAVDEAVKWLILVIQKLAPIYIEKFHLFVDMTTYQAFKTIAKELGIIKF
jgi:hypothetical protein